MDDITPRLLPPPDWVRNAIVITLLCRARFVLPWFCCHTQFAFAALHALLVGLLFCHAAVLLLRLAAYQHFCDLPHCTCLPATHTYTPATGHWFGMLTLPMAIQPGLDQDDSVVNCVSLLTVPAWAEKKKNKLMDG